MKKLVLTVASAVVTVASAYASAPQALYLPNDIGYGWNYSAPEMAHDGNKFSYMLEGKSADNDMFFFVSSKRADDWNGYTANGFNGLYGVSGDSGDATSSRALETGSYTVYPYGVLKHCYKLAKGAKYVVTMDFSTTPATMDIADGNAAPENLYFVYSNSSDGWHYSDAPAFSKEGGKYTYEFSSENSTYFFVARDRRSSWEAMTADNAGVAYMVSGDPYNGGNRLLDTGVYDITLYGSLKRCFELPAGDYVITADFTGATPTMSVARDGEEPLPVVTGATAMPEQYPGVMLQGFYWDSYDDTKWTNITAKAYDYSKYFDLIWVPNSGYADGYMGYMPRYWFTNHNSAFGSEEELLAMNSLMNSLNTAMIEDVVVNHRNGVSGWADFPTEEYNGVTWEWGLDAICRNDGMASAEGQPKPTGAYDTGDLFDGCRDLDHTNAHVQEGIKAYLDCLHNKYGYSGWRFDMVKGYGASYAGMYARSAGLKYSVGECWDGYDVVTEWIRGTGFSCCAFDFPLHDAFQAAFDSYPQDLTKLVWKRYGTLDQPAGVIHMDGFTRYAVTFVDNHDTYREGDKRVDNNQVAANAFILTHPGTPCVFMKHWLDNTAAIAPMVDIRKAVGVTNQSEVTVLKSSNNCYAARVKGLYGNLVVKIGSDWGFNCTDPGYEIKTSGQNYCIWADVDVPVHPEITVSHPSGKYETTIDVKLTADNAPEGSYIVYTLDGTYPAPANGTHVAAAQPASLRAAATATVPVSGNKTLRAALFSKDDKVLSSLAEREYQSPTTGITSATAQGAEVAYNATTASLTVDGIESPSVEVYTVAGTLVSTSADLSGLGRGVYLFRVTDGVSGRVYTGKAVR